MTPSRALAADRGRMKLLYFLVGRVSRYLAGERESPLFWRGLSRFMGPGAPAYSGGQLGILSQSRLGPGENLGCLLLLLFASLFLHMPL